MELQNNIQKWKRSVVHLECAADSIDFEDKIRLIDEYWLKLHRGEITNEEFSKIVSKGTRDVRCQGTAIFLKYNDRRYLITAKHVIHNRKSEDGIFNIIFRVPDLDSVLDRKSENLGFLMNLGAGTTDYAPYTYSEPYLDLAIISLDEQNSEFAENLERDNYVPIEIDDICCQPTDEGADIFSVGFPATTSVIGKQNIPEASKHWSSEFFSLPVTSFGKVSMLHDSLYYFWSDISIYPGNSGGPIIENNKLVGIVSAQSTISEQIMSGGQVVPLVSRQRIPFAKIIKSKYIYELLQRQIEKDKAFSNFLKSN
jgi:V8-like Glu-specific endopeptidase